MPGNTRLPPIVRRIVGRRYEPRFALNGSLISGSSSAGAQLRAEAAGIFWSLSAASLGGYVGLGLVPTAASKKFRFVLKRRKM